MMIHLVRHAHAGSRHRWEGDDEQRPLTDKGQRQADAIAEALAPAMAPTVLWSSHFLRCRQTLAPLAGRLGLDVVDQPLLVEGQAGPPALEALLAEADAGRIVAASSHGDVIPEIIAAAVRRGADLHGSAHPAKGARYELTVIDGSVTEIHHIDRPHLPT